MKAQLIKLFNNSLAPIFNSCAENVGLNAVIPPCDVLSKMFRVIIMRLHSDVNDVLQNAGIMYGITKACLGRCSVKVNAVLLVYNLGTNSVRHSITLRIQPVLSSTLFPHIQ